MSESVNEDPSCAFSEMDLVLTDLRSDIAILARDAESKVGISREVLARLHEHMDLAHQTLADTWEQAQNQRRAEHVEHAAALEAAQARNAPPSSAAAREHVEAMWAMLRALHTVIGAELKRANPPMPAAKPGRKKPAARRGRKAAR